MWLEDYLALLADSLALDRFQLSGVQTVFDVETGKRLRLIDSQNPWLHGNGEWDRLTEWRKGELKKILDSDQLRHYLSMGRWMNPLLG